MSGMSEMGAITKEKRNLKYVPVLSFLKAKIAQIVKIQIVYY